jgi:uncharacterized membrane protein YjfL (UPF0719 family)
MFQDVLYSLAYIGATLVLLAVGYFMFDLVTPGKLGDAIFHQSPPQRSWSAAVCVSGLMLALGWILHTAIITTNGDSFGEALGTTVVWGLVGVISLIVAFMLLDAITPGELKDLVCTAGWHPAALFVFATNIALGLIVAASIS